VQLTDLTTQPAAAWDELACRSPRGEALQSAAWGDVKQASGWVARRYRIDDGSDPVAVVSIQERDLAAPLIRRTPAALRGPMRDVGGALGRFLYAPLGPVLLRDEPGAARDALRGLRLIARHRHAALLVIDPCWEVASPEAEALAEAGFVPARRPVQVSTTGMFVPLHGDEDAQWRQLNQNARRNVEKCRKAGVVVARYDHESDRAELARALDSAYAMLLETGLRRGFGDVLRPAAYHNPAQQRLIESGNASLWVASQGGRELAHTLVHHSGDRAVLFEAGETDPDEAPTGVEASTGGSGTTAAARFAANFLLQWTIIRWAAESGFATYDMSGVDNHEAPGLPTDESHPLWSLFRFKSQWGPRPVQFVGAWEYAPWPLLGSALRAAWRTSDRVRERGQRA
jgi:peptidoglycan pentaglycine glycine transferase (the first glycine)